MLLPRPKLCSLVSWKVEDFLKRGRVRYLVRNVVLLSTRVRNTGILAQFRVLLDFSSKFASFAFGPQNFDDHSNSKTSRQYNSMIVFSSSRNNTSRGTSGDQSHRISA